MANSNDAKRGLREVQWLFLVFFVVSGSLGLLVKLRNLREEAQQRARIAAMPTPLPTAIPVVDLNINKSPWYQAKQIGAVSRRLEYPVIMALSPSGKYLAGVVPAPAVVMGQQLYPSNARQLVVWNAHTTQELTRFAINSESASHLQWSEDNVIHNFGTYLESWNWKHHKRLNATPSVQEARLPKDINVREVQIDPSLDLKTYCRFDGTLEAFRASTGRPLPPIKVPSEIKNEEGREYQWGILKASPQGPLTLVSSSLKPVPTPRPTSIPTSKPTPTPSPQLRKLLQEQTKLRDKVEALGTQLRDKPNLSAAEKATITQRMMELEKRLDTKNKQIESQTVRRRSTTSVATSAPARYGRIIAWDGQTGNILWRREFKIFLWTPRLKISPDRKIVAVMGTSLPQINSDDPSDSTGIELLSALTGKTLSHATTQNDFLIGTTSFWPSNNVLCVPDIDVQGEAALSFIDASNGKKTSWPFLALLQNKSVKSRQAILPGLPKAWTCDASGRTWIFASPWGGWRRWTSAQVQAKVNLYNKLLPQSQAKVTR